MPKWWLAGVSTGLCVAAAAGALAVLAARSSGPLVEQADIVISRGSVSDVAAVLQAAGAIAWRPAFLVLAEGTSFRGQLKAGEFRFPRGASLLDVLAILRMGRPVEHLFTIPEGLTAAEIARLLLGEQALAGSVTVPAEGSVLPQTYAFERGTSREVLLQRAQAAARSALREAWRTRARDIGVGSPAEALILASLVERETAVAAERPIVARVFLNRLRLAMRLQSDPTVIYGLSGGLGDLVRALTRADLQQEGPYNTYVVKGLPAGPICNPGLAVLDAVLHPAASVALYFVADGTGGHRFANTLIEHQRNVSSYRSERVDLAGSRSEVAH